jgi:ABC-type lipoprotein release transport system permease subunit
MTLRNDGNKKKRARAPMSRRTTWIVVAIAVAVLAFVVVVSVISGKGMF